MATTFDEILLKGVRAGKAPGKTKKAREWYRNQAKKVSKTEVETNKVVKEMKGRAVNKILVGSMYMYRYDPKHKATLPYYDTFPLVFPINKVQGGFLGLNLHYLPPVLRAKLMDALYAQTNNKKYDETTRLKVSYSVLSAATKFKEFKPTIKHYLDRQVKSRFLLVEPSEWDVALFLPTARFEGASKNKVWADSRKIIRG